MHSIVKYCFPFFPIWGILRGTHRMDLFVEVTYEGQYHVGSLYFNRLLPHID